MSSVTSFDWRIQRMLATIDQNSKPLVIDCRGEKEALLAELEAKTQNMTPEEREQEELQRMTPEEFEVTCKVLNHALDQAVSRITKAFNVKWVVDDNV